MQNSKIAVNLTFYDIAMQQIYRNGFDFQYYGKKCLTYLLNFVNSKLHETYDNVYVEVIMGG